MADGHTRILMALQHKLRVASPRIPELDSSVLGSTEYPLVVGCKGNTEHKVLRTVINTLTMITSI